VLHVARYRASAEKTHEMSYGAIMGSSTPDPTKIVISKALVTADDSTIYVAGHAKDNTLTKGSTTFNIFLQRINANDLVAGWTRSWGLDGAG